MRRNGLVAIATAVAALAGAVPAHAQSWRADIGVNGGGSWYSPLLTNDAWNGTGDAVRFKGNWLTGVQLGYWFTPRIGIRANGTYTDTDLKEGNGVFATDNTLYGDVNLWSATGDILFRFIQPSPQFRSGELLPYLALGLGAKVINPAGNAFFVTEPDGTQKSGVPFFCSAVAAAGLPNCFGGAVAGAPGFTNFFLTETTRLMGLVGLGTDLRLAPNFGLRLEVGDRIYKPEVLPIVAPNVPAGVVVPLPPLVTAVSTDNQSKTVHEVYAQLGLQLLLGVAPPPVVAVVPTPAPPPPAPPPPPATQSVSVCVVTPTTPAGLALETAVYNPATGDTTIVVNGTPTPLRAAFTGVPTAAGAAWYVQGQPLRIGTGRNSLAYVSFGTPRIIDINDLSYIGTVQGLPVYVNRSDAANLTIPPTPVEVATDPALLAGLRNVQVLYVPTTTYGCIFQPVQLQQEVRKVRG